MFPHYGNTKSGWREWWKSLLFQVAFSSEWWLHCILKNLIVLRLVTQSFWSKNLIECSGYDNSALSGVTSGTHRPQIPSNISSIVTRGRCHELQPRMVVCQICKPQSHTHWWDSQIHTVSYFKLQGSTPLVCICLLVWLCDFQVILDTTNSYFSFFDKVGSKDNLLSWPNPIEGSATSMSIQHFERCHLQTLLITIIVGELKPG
jgi:hypothetical protein